MFKLDSVESVKKAIRVDHDFDDDLILEVYLP
ncbi:phage gp6-like head-tail connector protein, partial [Staphylococcus xylosus]|nr:phage gp6-like head-tail connector protein [Staphylococcus xylosus]